jgi:hypothetical protein
MVTESSATRAASPRFIGAVGIVGWTLLTWACSGPVPYRGAAGGFLGGDEAGADPVGGADAATASQDAAAGGPSYMGKAIADPESDASGSVASADGYCPIPESLAAYGISCGTCAQTHCSSALAECDPTMVNACTEYYCPSQCLRPDAQGGVNVCGKAVQCCSSLVLTSLSFTCLGLPARSAQSACQSLLTQAQGMGRCP